MRSINDTSNRSCVEYGMLKSWPGNHTSNSADTQDCLSAFEDLQAGSAIRKLYIEHRESITSVAAPLPALFSRFTTRLITLSLSVR